MRESSHDKPVFWISERFRSFPEITHAVTTRHGGVSPAPFDTLNLGSFVGDDLENVRENLGRIHRALGLDANSTVDAKQAQAGRVARVESEHRGTRLIDYDGLMTNVTSIPLMLRFADCVPIFFYDRPHRAIAIAHAGWRGTIAKVVTNTVQSMEEAFGTRPADISAYIGPSIGPCCYEIGSDLQERVERVFPSAPHILSRLNGSMHLDLWEANAYQLRELGVGEIEVAGVCTSDNTEDFYSWRREKGKTGRFAGIIALNG